MGEIIRLQCNKAIQKNIYILGKTMKEMCRTLADSWSLSLVPRRSSSRTSHRTGVWKGTLQTGLKNYRSWLKVETLVMAQIVRYA